MEKPLLNNVDVFPTQEVLLEILGNTHPVYEKLIDIVQNEYQLSPEWNYYKDGKAWLCKVIFKKKTVFWLSVWDKYFRVTFYFTEKNVEAISNLAIDEQIKSKFTQNEPIGKLLPLTLEIYKEEQLKDLLKIIEYKKALK